MTAKAEEEDAAQLMMSAKAKAVSVPNRSPNRPKAVSVPNRTKSRSVPSRSKSRFAPGAALALLVASCGYTVVRGDTPFGAHRIAVIPFQEDEPVGLSTELSRELATLLAADGVHVSPNADAADGVLTGVVLAAATTTSPVAATGARIPAYRIRVIVQARLMDGERELWAGVVNANDSFLPSESAATVDTQTLETEANRRRALSRLASTIARDLHQQLVIASSLAQAGGD